MECINIEKNNDICGFKKIKLYKDIFGESPWNEGFLCINCKSIFSKNFISQCDCGNSTIEPFYKNNVLKTTFDKLSIKDGYSELIAKILEENIGFIWGWNSSISELNNNKLLLDKKGLEKLIIGIKDIFPQFNLENFYYFAEIGVKNNFRGRDIAGNLYRKNLDELKRKGEKFILVRTTRLSDIPYKWFIKEGYLEIFEYLDEQDRVILIYKI